MTTSSIQRVYHRIRSHLQWSWVLFIIAECALIGIFFQLLYTNLQEKAEAWVHLFEQRLVQTEMLLSEESRYPLPLSVTNISFDPDGKILTAFPERLKHLNIRRSGIFQKVKDMQVGQIHVLVYPDIGDGKQRVFFVRRISDRFQAATFDTETFFPPTTTKVSLALESRGVLLYSTISEWVGEPVWSSLLFRRGGKIYLASTATLQKTGQMRFFIIQDFSLECFMMLTAAALIFMLFCLDIRKVRTIRGDLTTLHDEQVRLSNLIKRLSRITGFGEQDICAQLGRLITSFSQSLDKTEKMRLVFVENRQYLNVLKQFMEDIISLLQKAVEDTQALQSAHDELEHRVLRRTAEMQSAKEAADRARLTAEAANRAKSDFLSNMSHELRTPLNAILGFSRIMQQNDGIPAEVRKHLRTININGDHLLSLINDLLDFSRIEAGRMRLNPETFNLKELLEDLELMFRMRTEAKGLALSFTFSDDPPVHICSDRLKLKQILINLLENAVKFTEKGEISLSVRCPSSKATGNGAADETAMKRTNASKPESVSGFQNRIPTRTTLLFEVEDTGPGIVEEDHERIFQLFEQTAKGRLTGEGTGMGLAISREYARMMGGRLTLESRMGQGSVFRVNLPVDPGQSSTVAVKPDRRIVGLKPDTRPPKILIVDDIETNRELIVQMIAPVGFQTREAVDGEDALHVNKFWQPDLILMDRTMPKLDGIEVTRRIRSASQNSQTPIITVSASVFEEERNEALKSGSNDFLGKPVHEDTLLECLGKHLDLEYIYADGSTSAAHSESRTD